MMEDLLATFMPKFTAIAKARVARSIELAEKRDPDAVTQIARELHSIAGEAGLLGISTVVALARAGEDRVRLLRKSRSDADLDALHASLLELQRAVDHVAK
jgi:chemotaxis protein histidine kinase CheA